MYALNLIGLNEMLIQYDLLALCYVYGIPKLVSLCQISSSKILFQNSCYLHAGYLMGSNSMTLSKYNKVDWTLLETLKLFDFNIFFIFSAIISLEILVLSSKICFE